MIVLSNNPTVTAEILLGAGGKQAKLVITYRVLLGKKLLHWGRRSGMAGGNRFVMFLYRLRAILKRERMLDKMDEIIVSWEGPVDEHDEPIPYSKDKLQLLMQLYGITFNDLVGAYLKARTDALLKN